MKILVCTGSYPTLINIKEAADVVSYSISSKLNSLNHQVDLQVINFENYINENDDLPMDTKSLFKTIHRTVIVKKTNIFDKIINLFSFFIPKNNIPNKIFFDKDKFKEYDLILPIWSEIATRVASHLPNKKVAYYGNLEFLVKKSNISLDFYLNKNFKSFFRYLYMCIFGELEKLESLHHLKKYSHVFNVSALDARILSQLGVKSSYIQMTWDKNNKEINNLNKISTNTSQYRVCCSVGKLSATGNTFSFLTLLDEIIPEIESQGLNNIFKLQIYGGGEFRYESIKNKLINKGVEVMGFVDDLDSELLNSAISIVPHNRFSHKVSHTRVLHNWSLGVPLILFRDSAGPMPELVHNYNCLLASSVKEFVKYMILICEDNSLGQTLAENGLVTLKNNFSSMKVTNKILSKI
mgnify:CR=1 FL=1